MKRGSAGVKRKKTEKPSKFSFSVAKHKVYDVIDGVVLKNGKLPICFTGANVGSTITINLKTPKLNAKVRFDASLRGILFV